MNTGRKIDYRIWIRPSDGLQDIYELEENENLISKSIGYLFQFPSSRFKIINVSYLDSSDFPTYISSYTYPVDTLTMILGTDDFTTLRGYT